MLKNWEQIYRNSGAAQAVCVDVGGFRLSPVFHLFFYPGDPISVVCLGSWTGLEISWRDRSAFLRELLLLLPPGERQGWHKYCLILGVLAVLFSFLIQKMEVEMSLEVVAPWRSLSLELTVREQTGSSPTASARDRQRETTSKMSHMLLSWPLEWHHWLIL